MDNTRARIVRDIDTAANAVASLNTMLKAVDRSGNGVSIGAIDTALNLVLIIVRVIKGGIVVVRAGFVDLLWADRARWPRHSACWAWRRLRLGRSNSSVRALVR